MKPFSYHSAETLDEAFTLLAEEGHGAAQPLAGGTDLLPLIKAGVAAPASVVDIKRVAALPRGVEAAGDELRLGTLATLSEIESHPEVVQRWTALAQAAGLAATPQLRNMATLGGNLLQRPRCWYFRNAQFHCWLKGGDECQARDGDNRFHALFGDSPCVATHPSDLASALLALDATVQLRGADGERTLPAHRFWALPVKTRRTEHMLRANELVLGVQVPALEAGVRSIYLKAMDRKVWAFALVGVAARLGLDAERRIRDVRLVLSGVAPIPWRAEAAERMLLGAEASPEVFARAAQAALDGAAALAHNGYKLPLAAGLVRRALDTLTEAATGRR